MLAQHTALYLTAIAGRHAQAISESHMLLDLPLRLSPAHVRRDEQLLGDHGVQLADFPLHLRASGGHLPKSLQVDQQAG